MVEGASNLDSGGAAAEATSWVELQSVPAGERERRTVAMGVARRLGVPLADARSLLELCPITLPRRLSQPAAEALIDELGRAGARAALRASPTSVHTPCATHPTLSASRRCTQCEADACTLCVALSGSETDVLCGACVRQQRRAKTFYRARVAVLLVLLAGVLLWAWRDVTRREARTDWSQSLTVAVVVVRQGPVEPEALALLRERLRVLQERLTAEFRRLRPGALEPFHFVAFGPVDVAERPPVLEGDDFADTAEHSYALWRYLSGVDDRAEVHTQGVDSRLYVVVRPPAHDELKHVEGAGEQGGRIGIVEVELDETMVDFALFVAAHELFHTLGATDKYDAAGHTLIPEGLAEPDRAPRFPQHYAEVMARNVAISATSERPPESLDELRVGAATAREVGWLR